MLQNEAIYVNLSISIVIIEDSKWEGTMPPKQKKIIDAWIEIHRDERLFKTVKISGLSIEWANGADICPDELYNNSKCQ